MKQRKLKRLRYNVSSKIRKEYWWVTTMRSFMLALDLQDKPPSTTFSFDTEEPLKPFTYVTHANAY